MYIYMYVLYLSFTFFLTINNFYYFEKLPKHHQFR